MRFPTHFRIVGITFFLTLLLSASTLFAQATVYLPLKDTVWMKVTYFDFHSDHSNPEFECDHSSGVYTGMADSTLPDNKIPRVGKEPYLNHYFKYWYVDWNSPLGGKGDKTKPFYSVRSGTPPWNADMRYDSSGVVDHDTAFKNIVIEDSLPFVLWDSANGLYRFEDTTFFPLENRGFGAEGRNRNFSFTMVLQTSFVYKNGLEFNFEGDDDVWTYINNRLALDLGGIHLAEEGTIDSDDLEKLNLTLNSTYDLDFYYAERHTNNSTIQITTNLIQPEIKLELKAEPDIVVEAGTIVTLEAEVSASDGEDYSDLAKYTKWVVIDSGHDHSADDLDQDSGNSVKFNTHTAYDTILIQAYIDIANAGRVMDTITIITTPGKGVAIFIEENIVDVKKSDRDLLLHPHPIDTVYIPEGDTTPKNVYAVVRDKNGAFVRMSSSKETEWDAKDDIVKVKGENNKEFHGIIERFAPNVDGVDLVTVTEDGLKPDDVPVVVSKWWPRKLRLVEKGHSVIDDYITKIIIETDSSEDYEVYALISTATDENDPKSWVKLPVDWDLSSPLDSGLIEAKKSIGWTYSPIVPGEGKLDLVNPDDSRTQPLTIPVEVIVSAPSRVEIDLITPESGRIAGKTIQAEVRIYNNDGLVRGAYCFGDNNPQPSRAIYQDTLGTGGRTDPKMTVDGVTEILNTNNGTDYKHKQCFNEGIDTVDFVLYYRARTQTSPESLHQISVILRPESKPVIKASTKKFALLAAEVYRLELSHDPKGLEPIKDTIVLKTNGAKTVYAQGYDRYGNYCGPQNSLWNTNGQLPPVDNPDTLKEYHTIRHSNPIDTIKGNLCATIKNTDISACAAIVETGMDAKISTAFTRDINGNGFLDRIDIYFSKGINLSKDNIDNFTVTCDLINFDIESIVALQGDSVYALYLKEEKTESAQTDWLPRISISDIDGAENENAKLANDGAAPVVWSVIKEMPTNSRKDDIVTITLSEQIQNINISNKPEDVFWVYIKENGNFTKVDRFDGAEIIGFDNAKTIKIKMSNGKDLNNSNWVNIHYTKNLISDIHDNRPDSMNQKVNVRVKPKGVEVQIGPNPFLPSNNIGPGKIVLHHNENAFSDANQNGGIVIVVNLPIPDDGDVFLTLKVYDVTGNLVNYSEKTNVMKDLKKQFKTSEIQSSQLALKYTWLGNTKKGMKAAPGVYKVVVSVDYESSSYSDARIIELVGVLKSGEQIMYR